MSGIHDDDIAGMDRCGHALDGDGIGVTDSNADLVNLGNGAKLPPVDWASCPDANPGPVSEHHSYK